MGNKYIYQGRKIDHVSVIEDYRKEEGMTVKDIRAKYNIGCDFLYKIIDENKITRRSDRHIFNQFYSILDLLNAGVLKDGVVIYHFDTDNEKQEHTVDLDDFKGRNMLTLRTYNSNVRFDLGELLEKKWKIKEQIS